MPGQRFELPSEQYKRPERWWVGLGEGKISFWQPSGEGAEVLCWRIRLGPAGHKKALGWGNDSSTA